MRTFLNTNLLLAVLLCLVIFACSDQPKSEISIAERIAKERSEDKKMEAFLDGLLSQMTLEEKVGQMIQLPCEFKLIFPTDTSNPNFVSFSPEWAIDTAKLGMYVRDYHVGSWLQGVPVKAADYCKFNTILQEVHLRNDRLKIPFVFGTDIIHGATPMLEGTLFPQNPNMAATFNKELNYQSGLVMSAESAAFGFHWIFNPELDLGHNKQWSRFFETYGEDPYLAGVMGSVFTKAIQENNLNGAYKQAGCARHYMGYSDPHFGKDRGVSEISDQKLYEYFQPSFQAAIDSGLMSVMVCSSEINGVPVHISKKILTTILRDQMGFTGVALSDWDDVWKLSSMHYITPSQKEAARLTVEAGLDMYMSSDMDVDFCKDVVALVKEGKLSEERIDLSVMRILRMKYMLNLFEQPMPTCEGLEVVGKAEHQQLAREAANESLVLLKNEGNLLPLGNSQRILLAGEFLTLKHPMSGSWTYTWQGDDESLYPAHMKTIWQAFGETFQVVDSATLNNLNTKAKSADAIILVAGEHAYTEHPGNRPNLDFDEQQKALMDAALATGKDVVIVLIEGRPLVLPPEVIQKAKAIVWAGLPGTYGADALADVLSGKVNPSGKLAFSYPAQLNYHLPYNHKPSDIWGLADSKFGVKPYVFEFGTGLSYTTFQYSNLQLSDTLMSETGEIEAKVTITNTGERVGKESVLWFVADEYGSITRPMKKLRSFEKLELDPNESKTVSFTITPSTDMAYPNEKGESILEEGSFVVSVGDLKQRFWLK